MRQYVGFLWFERTDSRYMREPQFDFARPENKDSQSQGMIERLTKVYLERAVREGGSPTVLKAIEDYPLVAIQCMYAMNNPEHINPTTIMSLVMSGLSVIWQFLVRFFLGGGGRAQSEPGVTMGNI